VSSDGTVVIGDNAVAELWVLRLPNGSSGEAKPLPFAQPFLESRSRNRYPAFSPDGGWVAYSSDETGSYEIYVVPYPGPGPKILISTEGGVAPHWSHDGRELFYRRPGGSQAMMVVDVQISPTFRAATPKVLFEDRGYAVAYDVSPDGKRLLMIKRPGPAQGFNNQVTIVLNWVDELRRRVPLPGK
jgi:Tol biopolymer transport system component